MSIFTASVRKGIYSVLAVVVPLLVTLGVINGDVAGQVLAIAAAVLATLGTILATLNITPDEEVSPE